jgi:hypothetical protein
LRLSSTLASYQAIITRWIDKFRKRYLEVRIVHSQRLDTSRFEVDTYSVVNAYFDVLTDLFLENSYPSDAIFNVDEIGFALDTTLPSKVVMIVEDTRAFKEINGRQEWITTIECIGASGVTSPIHRLKVISVIVSCRKTQDGMNIFRLA